jgi:hypothetical protein
MIELDLIHGGTVHVNADLILTLEDFAAVGLTAQRAHCRVQIGPLLFVEVKQRAAEVIERSKGA